MNTFTIIVLILITVPIVLLLLTLLFILFSCYINWEIKPVLKLFKSIKKMSAFDYRLFFILDLILTFVVYKAHILW